MKFRIYRRRTLLGLARRRKLDFQEISSNGNVLASSDQGYDNLEDVYAAIGQVRLGAVDAPVEEDF